MRRAPALFHGLTASVIAVILVNAASTKAAATGAGLPGFRGPEAVDVYLENVPAERLARVPYTGRTEVHYPKGYGGDRGIGACTGDEDLLIYSNTLSSETPEVYVYRPGRGVRIADDLVVQQDGPDRRLADALLQDRELEGQVRTRTLHQPRNLPSSCTQS